MKIENRKKIPYIILVSFAILVVYYGFRAHYELNEIRDYKAFSKGFVYRANPAGKSVGLYIEYYFYVNNEKFSDGITTSLKKSSDEYIKNKYFPVIYSKHNPEFNRILITPSDFYEFNLGFPDSLSWVPKFCDK